MSEVMDGMALASVPAPRAVAVYIRWSTDEQSDGTTLEVQRERCSLYIRSQGWSFSEELVYVDDGYSGASLDRPALSRLREAVRSGRVDCVVAYSIDRLSRNLADMTELIQREWAGRCIFRSATQPIGTDEGNPTGQLVFNILASFAEFERGLIRERTHSGAVRRAREGRYPGGPVAPYGYIRDGIGSLAVDEGRASVVRWMFEQAVAGPYGQGPVVIARALNGRGIPSPGGGKWWAASVREILRNPIYAGIVTYGRRKTNQAHVHDKGVPKQSRRETPLVRVDGAMPAIVSPEVWERAQELERERSAKYSKKGGAQGENRALLSGIAVCKCGGPLHIFYKANRARYYRCSRNAQKGGCEHNPGIYRADDLEQQVVDAVMERYGTPELREAALRKLEERFSTDRARVDYQSALEQVNERISQVEADLARLRRAARTGEIQLATYEELKADAEAELGDLMTSRKGLELALRSIKENTGALTARKETLARLPLWSRLNTVDQRQILQAILRSVEIYRARSASAPVLVKLLWEV
ncbi:MAG: recombinase family protein [Bacillota bacterium]